MQTQYNGFTLSYKYKQPSNTMGVNFIMYFPSVDGVEAGSPCNTPATALEEAKLVITRTEPYKLKDWLVEGIQNYSE